MNLNSPSIDIGSPQGGKKIIPLILSGGSGTRLWPVSRACKPKQFFSFGSKRSLFQETVMRCRSDLFDMRPIVVGADSHRFLLAEDLLNIGVTADILLEPVPRNSCAAIAIGAMHALRHNPDALVLVLASDHHIPDGKAFAQAVRTAAVDAADGHIVTFGVRPTRPATGYGYIAPGEPLKQAFTIATFVEKPTAEKAELYCAKGFLWNSGNFLFRADVLIRELRALRADILLAAESAYIDAARDQEFLRLNERAFAKAPSISVDYAVMEKTSCAAVLPVDYTWSDIGSWDAVAHLLPSDSDGNTVIGEACILEGRNNLVHSAGCLTSVVGLNDLIVVSTRDSVLVTDKRHAEQVKMLVERLSEQGRTEAHEALQIFRPWGNYEQLDKGENYQVKRITVKPGGKLSLQKHRHRAEHWVVVAGQAQVTIGDSMKTLKANESVHVALGAVHRLANCGDEPLVLIEVQTGDYLGEDDIIRLEDNYNRKPQPAGVME
jgi:mannose-1-phosphate guanylyltransferase/mannose-6-phosphate isomerase